jgi:hypothetical protein
MWYLPLKWLTICSPCVQVSEERLIQLLEQINEQTQKKTKVTVRMLGTCWFDLYVSCSHFWVQCSFDVISASTMLSLTHKLLSYSWHIFLWQIQRRRNVFDDDEWRVKCTTSDMQGHMFQMLLCSVNCLFTNWPANEVHWRWLWKLECPRLVLKYGSTPVWNVLLVHVALPTHKMDALENRIHCCVPLSMQMVCMLATANMLIMCFPCNHM